MKATNNGSDELQKRRNPEAMKHGSNKPGWFLLHRAEEVERRFCRMGNL